MHGSGVVWVRVGVPVVVRSDRDRLPVPVVAIDDTPVVRATSPDAVLPGEFAGAAWVWGLARYPPPTPPPTEAAMTIMASKSSV